MCTDIFSMANPFTSTYNKYQSRTTHNSNITYLADHPFLVEGDDEEVRNETSGDPATRPLSLLPRIKWASSMRKAGCATLWTTRDDVTIAITMAEVEAAVAEREVAVCLQTAQRPRRRVHGTANPSITPNDCMSKYIFGLKSNIITGRNDFSDVVVGEHHLLLLRREIAICVPHHLSKTVHCHHNINEIHALTSGIASRRLGTEGRRLALTGLSRAELILSM